MKRAKWDERVQTPEEAKRMRFYVRQAEQRGATGLCATCAFRPGTEANGSAEVLDMIEVDCLLGGAVFKCHHGGEINPADGCIVEGTQKHDRICAGFAALAGPNHTSMERHLVRLLGEKP